MIQLWTSDFSSVYAEAEALDGKSFTVTQLADRYEGLALEQSFEVALRDAAGNPVSYTLDDGYTFYFSTPIENALSENDNLRLYFSPDGTSVIEPGPLTRYGAELGLMIQAVGSDEWVMQFKSSHLITPSIWTFGVPLDPDVMPTLATTTPVDPDPAPTDPVPVDPIPVDTTPVAPTDPTPVDPVPVDPTPVPPAITDPTPVTPAAPTPAQQVSSSTTTQVVAATKTTPAAKAVLPKTSDESSIAPVAASIAGPLLLIAGAGLLARRRRESRI